MKVLMIGDAEAGKTTYMVSMYKVMADNQNCRIAARNYEDQRNLLRLAEDLARGIYPPRTETRSSYEFTFRFEHEGETVDFFDFEWIDYRGGAILQSTEDPVAADLQRFLNEAISLIVFLDFSQLGSPKIKKQWRRLKQFIMNFAARANASQKLAITIMFTKCDLDPEHKVAETETFKDILNLSVSLAGNPNLFGMVAWSAINRESGGNIFCPFIHSMRFGMLTERDRQIQALVKRSFWEDVKAVLCGDLIRQRMNLIEAFVDAMNEMLEDKDNQGNANYRLF